MGPEFALALGLLMGCGGTPMDRQIPITRGQSNYDRKVDTLGIEMPVPAPPKKVWDVLGAVYSELGLTINFQEPDGLRLGSCYQRVKTRLGKALLSTYIDCGESRGLPSADRFEIDITVLTTVRPNSSGTSSIYTFVLGVGSDPAAAGVNRIWCYSKGALEERIREGLEVRTRA